MAARELTGRKVLAIVVAAFAVIIGANLTLAVNAVATFPGLETKNTYVASQTFDADRRAQAALGWSVAARLENDQIILEVTDSNDTPVQLVTLEVVLGRATQIADDRPIQFAYRNGRFVADEALAPGKWYLRLAATAENGTTFRQRIALFARPAR